MPTCFLVHNPNTGSIRGVRAQHLLTGHFAARGWDCRYTPTRSGEDLPALVRAALADDVDICVAAGGDGTVSGAAGGLVGSDIPLAIIPLGTANGLACDMGIPPAPRRALELVTGPHTTRPVDAIVTNDHVHLCTLGVGLTPAAMHALSPRTKKLWGRYAYALAVLRALPHLHTTDFCLTVDGQLRTFQASEVLLVNSLNAGAPIRRVFPGVRPDDGVLDLFVIQMNTTAEALRVVANILAKRTHRDPSVTRLPVRQSLTIATDQPRPAQADGDPAGATPITARLLPGAVRVVVPG